MIVKFHVTLMHDHLELRLITVFYSLTFVLEPNTSADLAALGTVDGEGYQRDEDKESGGDKNRRPKSFAVRSDGFKWRKYGRKTVNGAGM
jgi:hypothetical protein